jgi:hypothetical protein
MKMADLSYEHALDRADDENARLAHENMELRKALNEIIMLEYTHAGTRNASVIQQACDIARIAIYGRTRKESEREALRAVKS